MRDFSYEDLDMVQAKELEENERYEAKCSADEVVTTLYKPISDPRTLAASWMKGCLQSALKDTKLSSDTKAFVAEALAAWFSACPEMRK